MKKYEEIEYKNEKYILAFNLNSMGVIQDKYGTLQAWADLTDADEPNANAIIYGYYAMLNEGIDIYNEDVEKEQRRKPLTLKQVGRIISEVGLEEANAKLQRNVVENTKSDEVKNV